MTPELIRVIIAGFFAAMLGGFALAARGQPFRQAALGLAGLALAMLAGYNYNQSWQNLAWAALVLLVLALVFYILSWRSGEMLRRHEEMHQRMVDHIKKRREAAEKRPPSSRP